MCQGPAVSFTRQQKRIAGEYAWSPVHGEPFCSPKRARFEERRDRNSPTGNSFQGNGRINPRRYSGGSNAGGDKSIATSISSRSRVTAANLKWLISPPKRRLVRENRAISRFKSACVLGASFERDLPSSSSRKQSLFLRGFRLSPLHSEFPDAVSLGSSSINARN